MERQPLRKLNYSHRCNFVVGVSQSAGRVVELLAVVVAAAGVVVLGTAIDDDWVLDCYYYCYSYC